MIGSTRLEWKSVGKVFELKNQYFSSLIWESGLNLCQNTPKIADTDTQKILTAITDITLNPFTKSTGTC